MSNLVRRPSVQPLTPPPDATLNTQVAEAAQHLNGDENETTAQPGDQP